jgi:hypothetical protein
MLSPGAETTCVGDINPSGSLTRLGVKIAVLATMAHLPLFSCTRERSWGVQLVLLGKPPV